MKWIINWWWRKRQRKIDLEILWPACKHGARDLEHARFAFLIHVAGDPAWSDISQEEIEKIVSALT